MFPAKPLSKPCLANLHRRGLCKITHECEHRTHGRRSRGDRGTSPPRIWSKGDAKANCSPQISSYSYKNERSVAFKIRQNPLSAGALPGPRCGSSLRSPRPPSRLERGHPSPYSTPLGTDLPSARAMRSPRNEMKVQWFKVRSKTD